MLSFSSIIDVATQLNNNKHFRYFGNGSTYIQKYQIQLKKEIIDPYISIKDNEARISLRIMDSQENLRRNDLINKINFDLKNELGLKKIRIQISGCINII